MLDDPQLSPFQVSVYRALMEVPRGRVISYKALGKRIGCGSAQAIGQAMRNNPFAPEIPCHRVVGANGKIGGYLGATEGEEVLRKMQLLAREGVHVDENGFLIDYSLMLKQ